MSADVSIMAALLGAITTLAGAVAVIFKLYIGSLTEALGVERARVEKLADQTDASIDLSRKIISMLELADERDRIRRERPAEGA